MTHSYERTAADDNSYGIGNYPLPPQLSSLGRFVSALAPTKLVAHNYFVQDQIHMLTVKANNVSVMGDDMKSLLRLGLSRIQSNSPGTLAFYFEGYPVEAQAKTAATRVASRFLADRLAPAPRVAASYNWDGEMVPLSKLIPKAEAKDIVMMNEKPIYHLVMKNTGEGGATVFTIPKRDWEKAKVKDQTTEKVKAEMTEREIKDLVNKLSMSDAVEFNTWAKKEKPSDEKKLEWLRR